MTSSKRPTRPAPPRARRRRVVAAFSLAAAATLGLQALAYAAPSAAQEELFAVTWMAAAGVAVATALVCVRLTAAPLRRSWLIWAGAVGTWLTGAALQLAAALTDAHGFETAADLAWLVLPVVAGLSIAFDAPRGSLSFGLFLLDAIPIVLLVTVLVRFATPHPLEQAHPHELLHLGFPLLYVLVALVGIQLLMLERDRLRSPNLWGFGVAQPLLAVGAIGWPLVGPGGAGAHWFPWEAFWTLGMLTAGAAAVHRATKPFDVPELRPLDENGLRAIPTALGVLGLLVVTAFAPNDYRAVPAALAVLSLGCLTARAIVVQREHRLAHATLEENAEKLRTLVSNIPGVVYRCRLDAEWTIEFMSDEIESLTGHPAEHFVHNRLQSFGSIEHPEDTEALNRHIRSRVEAGRPYAYEYRIVRADGDVRWVLDRGQAAYGRDGPLWVDGVLLDVSERKAAEERLERQTELLWLLQRVAVAANEAREPEEAFQVAADEVCASTGWPLGHVLTRLEGTDELVSTGIWHADDPDATAAFREVTEARVFTPGVGLPGRVLATRHAEWVEDFGVGAQSPRNPHALALDYRAAVAFPVLVGTEVVGVLEFFAPDAAGRDENLHRIMAHIGTVLGRVVERTRAEHALAEQNEALRQLDGLKDEFVSLVSHELRTPLTSIRGYLELVLNDVETPLGEQHRAFLDVVQRNADRLLRLVGDLLFVAQVDAGRLAVERTEVDLAAVAAECVKAAEPIAARREVRVAVDARPTILVGDRARLGQLLDNLVSNAIKFSPEGGKVCVRVAAAGGRAELEVSDGGIGIPADEQDQLFERFFRSSNARRAAIQGTGLGLVIVRAIAEAHGGTVAVTSGEGEGTTFRVELPLVTPEPEISADESAPVERAFQEAV